MGPEQWSHPWELNPKPIAYEAIALPIELGWHRYIIPVSGSVGKSAPQTLTLPSFLCLLPLVDTGEE